MGQSTAEVVQKAIDGYLDERDPSRFLAWIARAAPEPGEDTVAVAEEALPFDNESLALPERTATRGQ